jgi:UDP-N-acetylglucosamine 2-epimerase (non-hydrolysing)
MPLPLKVLVIAGARPNFVKIAPLMAAAERWNRAGSRTGRALETVLVHTGQHYDERMSEIFFKELGIPEPEVNLEVGSGSHAVQTANIMLGFEPVCLERRPDWVVVVGDVNSTVACTLVAAKLGIRVAHVEAGLRSRDRSMPEEVNRLVTDALADLLLTPSADADDNLRAEGVPAEKIRCVGNVMIDALVAHLPKARARPLVDELKLAGQGFCYVTLHRPGNVDDPRRLEAILAQLRRLSLELPVVFPMHPRTRKIVEQHGLAGSANGSFKILEPVGYLDSLCLSERARFVLTDSGGIQEETTFFRTPCLTLRPNTERPITVTVGSNQLTDLPRLWPDIEAILAGDLRRGQIPPLWDGAASDRIVGELVAASAP